MGIHKRRHAVYVEGCFGCKIGTISFGTVPGGHKDAKTGTSRRNRKERELDAYREARRAGEQPDSTTFEGIAAVRQRQEKWDKTEHVFSDHNPPEVVKKLKKGYTNTE